MQGFDYIPRFIGRPVINEKDETALGNGMRTLELAHLLPQHIRSHMQSRLLVIAGDHKCHYRLTPRPSALSVLHITRHMQQCMPHQQPDKDGTPSELWETMHFALSAHAHAFSTGETGEV